LASGGTATALQWWRRWKRRSHPTGIYTDRQARVGVMKRPVAQVSPAALKDAWQRRATAAAIEAARQVVQIDGPIPPGTPIGRLGEIEWGWITAAILFGWISTRAQQAASEQLDTEQTIRLTGLDPDPWDAGAVVAILPEVADTPGMDWSKPLADWPRETMVEFLKTALALIRKAVIARDLSDKGVTRKSSASMIARQVNAAPADL
jgi:hypothetical protein